MSVRVRVADQVAFGVKFNRRVVFGFGFRVRVRNCCKFRVMLGLLVRVRFRFKFRVLFGF